MREHIGYLFTAIVAVVAWHFAAPFVMRLFESADQYMIVSAVQVPDFKRGADPRIAYRREVFKPFNADWYVDLKRVDDGGLTPICSGSGRASYKPEEVIGAVHLFDWYMARPPCALEPGPHVLMTVWTKDNGLEIKNTSNVFNVLPAAD